MFLCAGVPQRLAEDLVISKRPGAGTVSTPAGNRVCHPGAVFPAHCFTRLDMDHGGLDCLWSMLTRPPAVTASTPFP